MSNLTQENDVVDLMLSSKTVDEWNDNCDRVKEANGGQYPGFWYKSIIQSGVLARSRDNWPASDQ